MAVANIRVYGIADTLRRLDSELGDNGKVYRQTVKAIKDAGNDAAVRARGYLPDDTKMPRGFAYQNNNGWSKSRTDRERAFPRYEQRTAQASIRVVSARDRAVRTETGWRGGKMFGIGIEMRDPAGSIYDVAGNGKSKRQTMKRMTSPKSAVFVGLLRRAWIGDTKWRFRVILPAVVDTRPDIIKKIYLVLEDARIKLDAARDGSWSSIK